MWFLCFLIQNNIKDFSRDSCKNPFVNTLIYTQVILSKLKHKMQQVQLPFNFGQKNL